MRVSVRLHPTCHFEIGERTIDTRGLVKQYVKAFAQYLGAHSGRPPGSVARGGRPPTYFWADANWRFSFTLERTRGRLVAWITRVERA